MFDTSQLLFKCCFPVPSLLSFRDTNYTNAVPFTRSYWSLTLFTVFYFPLALCVSDQIFSSALSFSLLLHSSTVSNLLKPFTVFFFFSSHFVPAYPSPSPYPQVHSLVHCVLNISCFILLIIYIFWFFSLASSYLLQVSLLSFNSLNILIIVVKTMIIPLSETLVGLFLSSFFLF